MSLRLRYECGRGPNACEFQAFLNPCSPGGQKGFLRSSRKRMIRLVENFASSIEVVTRVYLLSGLRLRPEPPGGQLYPLGNDFGYLPARYQPRQTGRSKSGDGSHDDEAGIGELEDAESRPGLQHTRAFLGSSGSVPNSRLHREIAPPTNVALITRHPVELKRSHPCRPVAQSG
jgi:hypothetical protein